MRTADALHYLKRVKALGFREEEIDIPIPLEKMPGVEIPAEENFPEMTGAGQESFHETLLLSDFPYSMKGAFAFSALSTEFVEIAAGDLEKKEVTEKGKTAKIFRFAKKKSADWAARIDDAGKSFAIFDSLPETASGRPGLKIKFALHGDGKNAHCYVKIAGRWKKIFSLPLDSGGGKPESGRRIWWHVPGKKFLATYSGGGDIYEKKQFNPSLGNLIFVATPDAEYGWIAEERDCRELAEAGEEFAEIRFGGKDANAQRFADFFVLSALLKDAAYAEMKGKVMHTAEFYANVPYMLARAEAEKAKGNRGEALLLLRTVSDIALLALRCAPFGGRMLEVAKYFDANEDIAQKKFALDKGLTPLLKGLWEKKSSKIEFGEIIKALHASGFSLARPALWKELRGERAALLIASHHDGLSLSLLDEESKIAAGSDIMKIELVGTKIIVKRAMVCESGNAKEIKAHLARIIEIGDRRSIDEREYISEMGSWGEAVYEIVKKNGRSALACVSAKRFY